MVKEEARSVLKAQLWKENQRYNALTIYRLDLPAYDKVCDALNSLNMGFYSDTLALSKKEAEKFRNVNVGLYQFLRGDISLNDIQVEKYVPPTET